MPIEAPGSPARGTCDERGQARFTGSVRISTAPASGTSAAPAHAPASAAPPAGVRTISREAVGSWVSATPLAPSGATCDAALVCAKSPSPV